jgi:histidine triad (HIT) family protein
MDTIFSDIIQNRDGYIVWEDDSYMAFLTPYPNTPGLTIVVPKENPGDYIFSLKNDQFTGLLLATKKVANILERAFDINRVALVFEGTGVPHVHAKLYPLYGENASKTDVWSDHIEYADEYRKYVTTVEGPEMSHERLKKIQDKILSVQ